jgi:hypothetical protein
MYRAFSKMSVEVRRGPLGGDLRREKEVGVQPVPEMIV